MKRLIVCFFVLVTIAGYSQQSIGLRLGDPTGVVYKKFVSRSQAFELVAGSAPTHWHDSYYINSFSEYAAYEGYRYQNHTVQSTIYLQARYLIHYPIPVENLIGKVSGYWGAGAMLKSAKVQYRFQDGDATNVLTDTRNDLDFGPEGILGMDYTFDDVPLTVFGEGSLLLELADRPVTPRVFGCLGLRYNF